MTEQDIEVSQEKFSSEGCTSVYDHTKDYHLGEWVYWTSTDYKGLETERLGCIVHIGSNNIDVEEPYFDGPRYHSRIHVKELHARVRKCPNAKEVIQRLVEKHRTNILALMGEIKDLCQALGVNPSTMISDQSEGTSNALAVMNNAIDPNDLKNSLVHAKEKTLPDLYKRLNDEHKRLAQWMGAESIELKCQIGTLNVTLEDVERKIFNVSLYAGLTERVAHILEGEPAARDKKLHLLQRRLYMDEECLLDYDKGGMDFEKIQDFDSWLSRPHNMNRILPFPKCIVTMQVRRNTKERHADSPISAWINMHKALYDTATYFYMRNGENLYRLGTDIDFGEMFFPSVTEFNPHEAQMVRKHFDDYRFMCLGEFEVLSEEFDKAKAEYQERKALYKQWEEANPDKNSNECPFDTSGLSFHFRYKNDFKPSDWELFEPDYLYYDEAMQQASEKMQHYNRVALVVQGILDRSSTFQPHAPVKLWTKEGADFLELVDDASGVLTYGEAPDYEEYAARLREHITPSSVLHGQQLAYEKQQAEIENRHRNNNPHLYREYHSRNLDTFLHYGDPGPGDCIRAVKLVKGKTCARFEWKRARRGACDVWDERTVNASCVIPLAELFNVSAYKVGDFKQFFQDPRTRAEYLKWAPTLLAAEEYYAKAEDNEEKG